MNHPLTDEMIEDIAYETIQSDETVKTGGLGVPAYHKMFLTEAPLSLLYPDGSVMLRYDDMRAAFDKGADWRLKQVFEWIRENLSDGYYGLVNGDEVLSDLKKAMYPQLEILGFLGDLEDQEES